MVHIQNPEFFDVEVHHGNSTYDDFNHEVLINVYARPENITLQGYRNTPFATFILTNQDKERDLSTKELVIDFLRNYPDKLYSASFYYDGDQDLIDDMMEIFGSVKVHSNIITNEKTGTIANMSIMAIPFCGILRPFISSNYYDIINSGLVMVDGAPFDWEGEKCRKLLYMSTLVHSHLDVNIYQSTGKDDTSARPMVYHRSIRVFPNEKGDLMHIEREIPLELTRKTSELLKTSPGNIFHATQDNSRSRSNTISVQM